MREVVVVTHSEASHAVEGLVGGWHDASLTKNGLQQAERIADRLGRLFHGTRDIHMVSSDLRRTRQTATAI